MSVTTQADTGHSTILSPRNRRKPRSGQIKRAATGLQADGISTTLLRLDAKQHTCREPQYFSVHPFVPCFGCLSDLSSNSSRRALEKPALLTRDLPAKGKRSVRVQPQALISAPGHVVASVALPKIDVTLASSKNGYKDYDVSGHPVVTRITVDPRIRKGDNFNVYCTEGRKTCGIWQGKLENSVVSLFERLRTEMPV